MHKHKEKIVNIRGANCKIDEEIAELVKDINNFNYGSKNPFETFMSCQEREGPSGFIGGEAWVSMVEFPNFSEGVNLWKSILKDATNRMNKAKSKGSTCKKIAIEINFGEMTHLSGLEYMPAIIADCSTQVNGLTDNRKEFEDSRRDAIENIRKSLRKFSIIGAHIKKD